MDERGFFKLRNIDKKYYTIDLREKFGIEGPVCDGYGHHKNCNWFVQEIESSDIDYGVEQLESTVKQLEIKGYPVDKIFLIINRFKSKKFQGKHGVIHVTGSKTPYMIRGKKIYIVKNNDIKEELEWRFF